MKRITCLALVAVCATAANAQQILTRGALNALLVSSTTDDFETYAGLGSGAVNLDVTTLDSTTIANGQGPGLVNPGATYSDPSANRLQWNGNAYFGITSQTILSNGSSGDIRIDYAGGVQAMGVDVENFAGFGYSGTMEVYNGATLVDTVAMTLGGSSGEFVFMGYQNAAGITHVIFDSPTYSWSPIIDDHTYGAVPEPTTIIALGAGLAALLARRRKA